MKWPKAERFFWTKSAKFLQAFNRSFCVFCKSIHSSGWAAPKPFPGISGCWQLRTEILKRAVREKLFREDLFYRLNVVRISVPPLRERRSDITFLAEHFLRVYSEKNGLPAVGFSDDAILMLQTYSYPGNVRELENMIERAVLMARGRVIMPVHFPTKSPSENGVRPKQPQIDLLSLPFHKSIAELERRLIEKALSEARGNKTEAADRLQINRRLLYSKMDEHQIKDKD